jgi:transaldolase
MYVTELVAPGTVNTMPEATLEAFADHGELRGDAVRSSYAEARQVMDELKAEGIDIDEVTELLEREGVEKFEKAWQELLDSVKDQLAKAKKGNA